MLSPGGWVVKRSSFGTNPDNWLILVSRRRVPFVRMERLRIGDVATRSGVTRDAIRFYERSGLLDEPGRTKSRQRIYDRSTLDRIRLVRQLQNCGLTIGDIKEILFLRHADRPAASKRLMEILRRRLEILEQQVTSLESCRARLIDVMRDVAGARSGGYDKLRQLPDVTSPPPFRFGRRRRL